MNSLLSNINSMPSTIFNLFASPFIISVPFSRIADYPTWEDQQMSIPNQGSIHAFPSIVAQKGFRYRDNVVATE